jgi:hypothetical protein
MESNWATEHLQTIRTLMERAAVYRRALAPIMTFVGALGAAAALAGWRFMDDSPRGFILFWEGVAILALIGAFLLVRRQALKDAEPFWSPPSRRVAQGLFPPLFIGMAVGLRAAFYPTLDLVVPLGLPAFWMLLYGCALNAAGFFMPCGIKWLGWLFIIAGLVDIKAKKLFGPLTFGGEHLVMGCVFGGLHLAYGIYLYFTERRRNET